jgi:hypothetical protein
MWIKAGVIIITIVFVAGLWMVYDGIYKPAKKLQNITEEVSDTSKKTIGKFVEEKVLTKENIDKGKKKGRNFLKAAGKALKEGAKEYKELEGKEDTSTEDDVEFE